MASRIEEMRDYLISKGMDPDKAQSQAERSNRRFLQSSGVTGAVASGAMLPGVAAEAAAAPTIAAARQWLMSRFAPSAAKDAVLMEPAAGAVTREAITRGTMMTPQTAGATIAAGAPAAMPLLFSPNLASKEPVAYDMDAPPTPRQNFDDWGHKIVGPSAATSSMDAPPDAVSSAMRVLRAPTPPRRSEPVRQTQAAAPSPQSLWEKYNETGNAADFVRADRAMMEAKKAQEETGKAKGGSVNGKDAALHKALEIIHHLLTRGH